MFSKEEKIRSLSILVSVSLILGLVVGLVEGEEDLEKMCELEEVDLQCNIVSKEECQALLERCKAYYEEKSSQLEMDVNKTKQKEQNYENQVYLLNQRINRLENQIYQSNLIIRDLNIQIEDTESSIQKTSSKITDIEEQLATILQTVYEEDQKTILEILLSEKEFSDFFNDLVSLEVLSTKNKELLKDIRDLKSYLEEQKESLDQEKEDLERQVLIQRIQQEEGQEMKQEKQYLLRKVRGEKQAYQEYLSEVQEKAQEIRRRIFQLAQIPESEAPTLEEAYSLAKFVERVTGVRPAFLLGLLQVESRIGQNVGQCNCPTCRYPDISWKTVMSRSQWDSFLTITEELGLSPNQTPVSCWVGGGKIQMGGAMGPAQFMPTTWLDLGYKDRVEEVTGNAPANPWRVQDAFLAAGLYLADWGAGKGAPGSQTRYYNEIGAATAYLCGTNQMTSRCISSGGKAYIYGWTGRDGQHRSGIMDYASEFQGYIDSGVFD